MIEPITQGDYDGLCGLYCIINAIRLVLAPHRELTRAEVKALFAGGVRFLARQGSLPAAVHSCVRKQDWPKLAAAVVTSAQQMADRPILLQRHTLPEGTLIEEALRSIERMITAGKAPCLFLRGSYRHYSVISGYTPATLKLFDSYGYHRLQRKSCGTDETRSALHRLYLQSFLALTAC